MDRILRELAVAMALLVLLALLAVFAPHFYEGDKLRSLLVSSAPVLVAVVGMTLVILARHIDISIGAQFSVCAIVAGSIAKVGWPAPLEPWDSLGDAANAWNLVVQITTLTIMVGGTLLTGAMLGAINGVLVAGLRLPSIVVTLATMVIWREALRWQGQGEFVKDLPAGFQWFGLGQGIGRWVIVATALVVFLICAFALRWLSAGRAVYATGSDSQAAWLVGVRPRWVVFGVFVLMGTLTALAALLNAVRFVDVDPNGGTGLEMQVIAAVVVGGVAVSGGRGSLVGPLIGLALLATIGPALVFFGAEAHWEKAIQGGIILVAVAADGLTRRRRNHARTRLAAS